ncbi:MAG: ketopantoate reductase family protein [Deltaproteobacteria bacterium]|nr:ketopantoate reductase family protein [Deltaproteobacteria bacterium]
MKIVIMGAGAVGGVVGAFLARSGEDVTLIGRESHVRVIEANGLEVFGVAQARARVRAITDPSVVKEADFLLIAVKARDTAAALGALGHLRPGCVASLQNGVAKNDHLAAQFGREPVIGAMTGMGATVEQPGKIRYTMDNPTFFGELDDCRSRRVEEIVATFNTVGLPAQVPESIAGAEWSKMAFWLSTALLSALTRLEIYKVLIHKGLATLFATIVKEAGAVAAACGVHLSDFPPILAGSIYEAPLEKAALKLMDAGRQFETKGFTRAVNSVLQDVLAGRRTEMEETGGDLVRRAREKGIPVPVTEMAVTLLRGIDAYH